MNFTETFSDFSSRLGATDLALWAGVALVLWVLFGDKLGGVKNLVNSLLGKLGKVNLKNVVPVASASNNDKFFQLLTSWKRTRDLAVEAGCSEAVKVADQMFPLLSPQSCEEKKV